jgi:hypothetical protein
MEDSTLDNEGASNLDLSCDGWHRIAQQVADHADTVGMRKVNRGHESQR